MGTSHVLLACQHHVVVQIQTLNRFCVFSLMFELYIGLCVYKWKQLVIPYLTRYLSYKHNIQQINLQVTCLKHFPCIDSEPCIFIGNLAVAMYRNSIHVNLVINYFINFESVQLNETM